jgi:mono/diheme cytochrome c family protein
VKLRAPSSALIVALVIAGCGGGGSEEETPTPASGGGGSADAGKELFVSNCGNCHTLAAAGASGKVGPDLDALKPGPDTVNAQVTNGGGGMPAFANKLSAEQIQQISDYVAENSGQ